MKSSQARNEIAITEIGIDEGYGRIFSFIDFANVNNWFSSDNQTWDHQALGEGEHVEISLNMLKSFTNIFSLRTRLYYGHDTKNSSSVSFTYLLRKIFGKRNVVTKDLQRIKHYFQKNDRSEETPRSLSKGSFVEIRKCNFDVEITVDALKSLNHYDTFCLFSGDADFAYLNEYLKRKGKRVILIKSGYIASTLRKSASLVVSGQKIKRYITYITKQRPE